MSEHDLHAYTEHDGDDAFERRHEAKAPLILFRLEDIAAAAKARPSALADKLKPAAHLIRGEKSTPLFSESALTAAKRILEPQQPGRGRATKRSQSRLP